MSLNPLNELKRRLEDNDTPLPKRLCLAKNVIKSHHFPSAPKERVVADWLQMLTQNNKLSGEHLRSVIGWLSVVDDVTGEMKSKLIQVVSQYLKRNPVQKEDVPSLLLFIENPNLSSQFGLHIEECLSIAITLLQYLKSEESEANVLQSQRVFNNIVKFYKESKKKLEFIVKLLEGENLETIFSYLDSDRSSVVAVCGNILFPMNKKSFFGSYLQTLVRKDNIQDLIAEKGDNIQSVLKIMDVFFAFPKGRTESDAKFLSDFIDIFVSCYFSESQLIFAFYVMIANVLDMEQNYLTPAMEMKKIVFEDNSEKIKRNLFLCMLDSVLKNEVDISVRLTDTLGVKIAKVETKKTFILFLENVMQNQLKLDKKPDKATFEIIKTALKLDPVLIEHKMNDILPQIMSARKATSVKESYTEMLNYLLETLFKLSRGTLFLNQILPTLKTSLEAGNTEQLELKEKVRIALESGQDCDKINGKIITGNDVFPEESILLFGKLTSELMFRQNKDLLLSLQKDFEENCLINLGEDEIRPSTLILTEVLSALLSSFLCYNKLADHTVPLQIAADFWSTFKNFETDFMGRFGECVLKHSEEPQLLNSFLKVCRSCAQLKLLNIKYSNTKLDIDASVPSEVHDLSFLLPCLSGGQWTAVASNANDEEAKLLLDEILVIKTMAIKTLQSDNTENNELLATKAHVIKHLSKNAQFIEHSDYISNALLVDLDSSQLKQLAKIIVKLILNNSNPEILGNEAIISNRQLQNMLILETVKHISKCFDNTEFLGKSLNKTDFELTLNKENMKDTFTQLTIKDECKNDTTLPMCVDILKNLKIYYLEESYQLVSILMLLAIKKDCQKKLRKNIDHILLSTFELSPNPPDLYKIFPVNFIFSFKDRLLIDLLTLKIKTSNQLFVVKCLVESAVKRVKTESEIVKAIVEILLKKQSASKASSIEFFSDPAFQISCTILPAIVKQKKAITISAYRSILADLQEKLHISLLNCFKNINFKEISSVELNETGNTDESMVVSESMLATLNAITAYSLTLSKYCETTDSEEIKNLDHLSTALEYFINNAVQSIQNPVSKHQHVESSIRLLNSVLRYYKRLETHEIFQTKDKLFLQIWNSLKARLSMVLDGSATKRFISTGFLEDVGVTLKFLCELVSVECFVNNFVGDLNTLVQFENPTKMSKKPEHAKTTITSHKVSKYLWSQILKANIVGPKCVALSKSIYQSSRNLKGYIQQHFEEDQTGVVIKSKKKKLTVEFTEDNDDEVKVVRVDDTVCEMVKVYLDTLTEAVLAAKKVNLDYKALDSIFEVEQAVHFIMGRSTVHIRCEVSWQAFFMLFEGALQVLNALIVSREELLEDRWPCFMQCYKTAVSLLCARAAYDQDISRDEEDRLGQLGHAVEKLTESICKRKTHVSKIAAYTLGEVCSLASGARAACVRGGALAGAWLRVGDAPRALAFLRRALPPQARPALQSATLLYRAQYKYTGNA